MNLPAGTAWAAASRATYPLRLSTKAVPIPIGASEYSRLRAVTGVIPRSHSSNTSGTKHSRGADDVAYRSSLPGTAARSPRRRPWPLNLCLPTVSGNRDQTEAFAQPRCGIVVVSHPHLPFARFGKDLVYLDYRQRMVLQGAVRECGFPPPQRS